MKIKGLSYFLKSSCKPAPEICSIFLNVFQLNHRKNNDQILQWLIGEFCDPSVGGRKAPGCYILKAPGKNPKSLCGIFLPPNSFLYFTYEEKSIKMVASY